MIPDSVVEEVRARADIVEIVGEHVPLKRSGKDYKANCPFHEERTPSFYVVPAKGFYNCFGCGESGDVFSFVMKRMGLDFVEAVKHVGQRAGVEVKEVKRGDGEEDRFRPLYEANAFAREFYRERLWEWDGGADARAYLEGRGIDRETAERFGLGYAPDEWRALRDAAHRHEIDDGVLLEVGLLNESERSDEPYDRFRNRIVFPIEVPGGRVVAFGGRILGAPDGGGPGAPKYLNSPETTLYHKGRVLYGLVWAKNEIRREEAALVVEGYMDLVSVAAAGVENVVATLGTSMTGEHADLLSRYTTRVLLLFDSDAAGLRATFRAADTLLAAGLHPAVVTLPEGEDPDTLVRKEGAEGLKRYLDQAVDVVDRKLQILEERDYFSSIEKTRDAVDRLLPTLRAAADPTLRDIYVSKVAKRTGVRPETLEAEMARTPARPHAPHAAPPPPRRDPGLRTLGMGAERKLLLLMVKDRRWVERAAERIGPDEISDAAYREVFQALVSDPELTHPPAGMDPVAARRLEELLASDEELSHAGRVFEESVGRIRSAPLARRAEELRVLLREESSEERRAEILQELQSLARERRSALRDWRSAARTRPDPARGGGEPSAGKSVP